MKKLLLFCLFLTPLAVTAAADNNSTNLKNGQLALFHGQKAIQQGNFERAKSLLQRSAALGYPGAAELLADLPQIATEYNQRQGPRKITIQRN